MDADIDTDMGKEVAPIRPGDRVVAIDGPAGTVIETIAEAPSGPAAIVVRTASGEAVEVPLADVAAHGGGEVRLAISAAALREGMSAPPGGVGEVRRLRLHAEDLEAATVPARRGVARVVRHVESVPVEETIDTVRDDVVVERVPVNREIDAVPDIRMEGDALVVPVVEEMLVTETRLVLREEVRITRRQATEPVTVRGTVRRERIEVVEDVTRPPADIDADRGISGDAA